MHQQISFKYPKIKITICLCVFVLFNYSNCQSQIKFDIEKWIADDGIDSLQINSYRAYIVDNGTFWELAKGKSKKQIQNIFGKYDFKGSGNKRKGLYSSYTYCIGKKKCKQCTNCNGASVSIFFEDGIAVTFVRIFSGG
jgi:hypothetical protein